MIFCGDIPTDVILRISISRTSVLVHHQSPKVALNILYKTFMTQLCHAQAIIVVYGYCLLENCTLFTVSFRFIGTLGKVGKNGFVVNVCNRN